MPSAIRPQKKKSPSRANKSLEDGLKCLQWILTQRKPASLQDIARALDFETTRTHRLLKTFVHAGFLRQTAGRRYEPGPAVFYTAMHTLHESHLLEAALPPLERLRRKVKYRVAMGLLWNRTVSYLYHAERGSSIEKAIGGCGLYTASESGIGLVTLAQLSDDEVRDMYQGEDTGVEGGLTALIGMLDEVRSLGYSFRSHRPWVTSTLALPMRSNPAMAVAVAGKIAPEEVPELLPLLRHTVEEIEEALQANARPASLDSLQQRRRRNLV